MSEARYDWEKVFSRDAKRVGERTHVPLATWLALSAEQQRAYGAHVVVDLDDCTEERAQRDTQCDYDDERRDHDGVGLQRTFTNGVE
jgi:hypothetical protein